MTTPTGIAVPVPDRWQHVVLGVAGAGVTDAPAADTVPIRERDIAAHRAAALAARSQSRHADVTLTQRAVTVGDHVIGIRQFVPHRAPTSGYLFFHGGGWVFGGAALHDAELADISHDLGVAVFSVEYRLAPDDPFPAALVDAEAAARWLAGPGRDEFGLGRLAIGGESAGAHLATIALQRLASTGQALAFCAANLVYGIFDLSMTPSQRVAEATPRMTRADLEWYYAQVMPGTSAEQRRDARVSPLYGDLTGMPPARFAVGTSDPLFDDSVFMAGRWAAAGSSAMLEIYSSGAHGLARQLDPLGRLARQREAAFLAAHLRRDEQEDIRL